MNDEEKKKNFLEALKTVSGDRANERQIRRINAQDKSVNLAQGTLDKDVLKASGGSVSADVSEPITKLKTGTENIDTKEIRNLSDIGEFEKRAKDLDLKQRLKSTFKQAADAGDEQTMDKLRQIAQRFGKASKTGLKSIPLVGGLASLAMNPEDASAAIPGLDQADSVGMSAQDENIMLAETDARMNYGESQASKDRKAALAKLLNKGK